MLLRYFFTLFSLFFITSCGFHPIYGDNDLGKQLRQIKVGNISYENKIPTLESIALRSALEHEFNWSYTESPQRYTLNLSYIISIEGVAVQSNALATRNNLKITLNYTLIDNDSGKIIERNTLLGVESFDIQSSPYSNYVSKEETAVKVMKSLATEVKLRLTGLVGENIKPGSLS